MAAVHDFPDDSQRVQDAPSEKPWLKRLFASRRQNEIIQERALGETVTIDEVVALVHYVAETGRDPSGQATGHLDELLSKYKAEKDKAVQSQLHTEILKAYAALTALTYQGNGNVNGRTVINSQYVRGDLVLVGLCGLLSFVAAASTHILSNYYEVRSPEGDAIYLLYQYVLVYLLPAFWGALGATVYLAVKIGDHARDSTFDSRKLRGQMSRIALGAVFASVLVHIFYSTLSLGGFDSIGPSGVAFLAGLGVKPIYSAFEAMVNKLSSYIETFDPKKQPRPTTTVTAPQTPNKDKKAEGDRRLGQQVGRPEKPNDDKITEG